MTDWDQGVFLKVLGLRVKVLGALKPLTQTLTSHTLNPDFPISDSLHPELRGTLLARGAPEAPYLSLKHL